MKYAIVIDGKVEKIFNDDLPLEVVQRNTAAVIVPDGASCEVGYVYSSGAFSPVESPIVTAFKTELQSYIDSLNAKPEYAGLNLLITDAPEVALGKLKAAGVTWADSVPLDMLKRNLKDAENN